MATEITILATRVMPSLDPKRMGQSDTMIVYQVAGGQGPPDHVLVPGEKPPQAEILQAIRESIKTRSEVEGKKFTL